jgi:hypothetical protein
MFLVRRTTQRSFAAAATSRQKRALNEKQLVGGEETRKAAAPVTPPPVAAGPTSSEGGGSNNLPVVLAVVAAAGVGAAYYMDMIPGLSSDSNSTDEAAEAAVEAAETAVEAVEAAVVPAAKENAAKEPEASSPVVVEAKTAEAAPKEKSKVVVQTKAKEAPSSKDYAGNRVVTIALPKGSSTRSAPPPPVATEHPFGGHKVAMAPATTTTSSENAPTVDAALRELQTQLSQETSRVLGEAHHELAKLSSLDMSELDSMTSMQLKIRLVQMTKDMEERTKWEAVRLKEFLAMKEKEVEDKYV